MASTKFYLDTRRAKPGVASILKIAICHERRVSYLSLDAKLFPDQWDSVKEKVINHPKKFVLTAYINEIKQGIDSDIIDLTRDGKLGAMSANDIREYYLARVNPDEKKNVDETLFIVRFMKFIEPKKESTKETYMHTLNRVRAFIGDSVETLHFEDMTKDWLTSFNTFMAKTSPSPNARNLHFRNLRAVFNDAIENDITTFYPFRKFKFRLIGQNSW